MAPATGPKNTAHNSHRLVRLGSTTRTAALAPAAIESAQPMKAFA